MTNSSSIVVGVDGSEASLYALRWAARRAMEVGAELEVLHTWHGPATVYPQYWTAYVDEAGCELDAKHVLERAMEDVDAGPVRVTSSLVRGEAAVAIAAAGEDAKQIVVGTHGHGFFGRALLGSVAERVLMAATVPVTVVPHSHHAPVDDECIVVGVDGSPSSALALRYAADVALAVDASLKVIHTYPIIGPHAAAEMKEQAEDLVHQMLSAAQADGHGLPKRVHTVAIPGSAGLRLLEGAASASEIVVGYSGAAERKFTLGSVSRRCVHQAPCPVTVIKSA